MLRRTVTRSFYQVLLRRQCINREFFTKNQSSAAASSSEGGSVDGSSAAEGSSTVDTSEFEKRIEDLNTKLKSESEQKEDFKSKYLLALAEAENTRKRMTKQLTEKLKYAHQPFCKDLVMVADTLLLAIESVPSSETLQSAEKQTLVNNIQSISEGIRMTDSELSKVFSSHGLKKIHPQGEKFDPNFHEAMFQVPQAAARNIQPGCIAEVVKDGYILHDRVVRAAKVGVVQKE